VENQRGKGKEKRTGWRSSFARHEQKGGGRGGTRALSVRGALKDKGKKKRTGVSFSK